MHRKYDDLRDGRPAPTWWMEEGCVPRWCAFSEGLGVYWRKAVLFEVGCQECGETFNVGVEWDDSQLLRKSILVGPQLWTTEQVAQMPPDGDPPNHRCIGAGDTMTLDPIRTVEVWERINGEAVRRTDLENIDLRESF